MSRSWLHVVRGSSVTNYTDSELVFRSDLNFSKRSRKNSSLLTLASYTSDIFEHTDTKPKEVAKFLTSPPIPEWELARANFDIDHTDLKKTENPNILAQLVRSHIDTNYSRHCKVFTDGSVLDNGQAGAGFVIPYLKKEHAYFLGRGYSVFTVELSDRYLNGLIQFI